MVFTVEDGTGVEDANAYAAEAFVDSYHTDRGNADWTGDSATKQAAIIKATDYIDKRFGPLFRGTKEFTVNDLEFPRKWLYNRRGDLVTGIPTKLKNAVAEYALIALSSALFATPEINTLGLEITAKREKVGPVEEETRYRSGTLTIVRQLPEADRYLFEYIRTGRIIRG